MSSRASGPSSGRATSRPSRRVVVVGGALALAGAAVTVATLGGEQGPEGRDRAPAPGPPAPQPGDEPSAALRAVLAEAEATAGLRLLGSPWARWAGRPDGPDATGWDGLYVSWLVRRHGGDPSATAPSDLLALVRERGQVGVAPAPGAIVFYDRDPERSSARRGEPARVGLVTSVTGAALAQTLEGDHPVSLPHHERFVRRLARPGPGPVLFALPAYDPDPSEDR